MWPSAVVDALEVVEVEEQDGHGLAGACRPGEGVLDAVAEQRLVGEVGERVVERLVGELALEALLLGDVAEAPHAADGLAVDPLRHRVALEDPSVRELDDVVRRRLGALVQLADLAHEQLRVHQLVEDERQGDGVVEGVEDLRRDLPQVDEALVEARDAPGVVDDEDPVGGGVEGRRQQGQGAVELVVGPLAVGDVLHGAGDDHAPVVGLGAASAAVEPAHLGLARVRLHAEVDRERRPVALGRVDGRR